MSGDLFYEQSQWVVVSVLIVLMLLAGEGGFRGGRRNRTRCDETVRFAVGTVQAAVLGLFGLLLAFTFAMAVGRFDIRKQLVVKEADAIGTTYLRADTLAEPHRSAISALLRRYVDARLDLFGHDVHPRSLLRALETNEGLQDQLWAEAMAATKKDRSAVAGLFLQSLNETIDLHADRVAARENHVPETVLLLLLLFAIVSSAEIGFTFGLADQRSPLRTLAFALVVSSLLLVIVDLDRPRRGFIQVSQKPMITLRDSLSRGPR